MLAQLLERIVTFRSLELRPLVLGRQDQQGIELGEQVGARHGGLSVNGLRKEWADAARASKEVMHESSL